MQSLEPGDPPQPAGRDIPEPIRFDEVADLYDIYVTADHDIAFFVREAKRSPGKVLELTCGTGRVSIPLVRAGVDLTCVDYSRKMLARLKEKLTRERLACTIVAADISELALAGLFNLVIIPFNSFQEIVEPARQQSALGRIAGHLDPGGRFICTLQNPAVRLRTIDGIVRPIGRFSLEGGGSLEVTSLLSYDADAGRATGFQEYTIYDVQNVVRERRRLAIAFCLFTRAAFEALAGGAGFRMEALYGDYDYARFDEHESPFMIWELTAKR